MFISVAMIILGGVTVVWGRWLLPLQLRRIGTRAKGLSHESYYRIMRHRGVGVALTALQWVGVLLVVSSVALLLADS
jgi:hypothetical protein